MYPSRSQPALNDLKPAPLAQHYVRGRDAHVIEGNLAMTVRRIVVPEDRQHTLDPDPRRGGWDEDDRLPLVHFWMIWGGLAHDHVDLAAEVAST